MRYFVTIDGEEHVVVVSELPGGGYDLGVVDGSGVVVPIPAHITGSGARFTAELGDRVFDISLDGELPTLAVWASGKRVTAEVESARMRAAASLVSGGGDRDGVLVSPMPGKIVKLLVKEGDAVELGAALIVVEAMKMENELGSPRAGIVQQVHVNPGDTVESGQKLVTVG